MYCHKCGEKLKENAKFCNKCGEKVNIINNESFSETDNTPPSASSYKKPSHNKSTATLKDSGKNPFIALILSLLIVGLGQFYNDETQKGMIMLVVAVLSGIFSAGLLWLVVALYSAFDAWTVAKSGRR